METARALRLLCAAALFLLAMPANAAELTTLQAGHIMAVAYGQYQGPPELLDNPPKIDLVSEDKLRELHGCNDHCPRIMALYHEGDNVIYLLNTLDFSAVFATTVLAHEFVHFFQVRTRGRIKDLKLSAHEACLEIVERERQAYRIQHHLLIKGGDFRRAQEARIIAGQLHCKEPKS